MTVLAAINNFWAGGRETFLVEHARELATRGVGIHLLAGNLSAPSGMTEAFPEKTCLSEGLLRGCLDMPWDLGTSLVWGQHSDLLGPWILSRRENIPLHTTFHGPLVGAGRPNSLLEALGMTLAITRGEGLSGVSEEVVESVKAAAPGAESIRIFRNATSWPAGASLSEKPVWKGRALLVTRSEKLGHLRAAFDFFSRAWKQGILSRLTVISAAAPGGEHLKGGGLTAARLLGRAWCASLGPGALPPLLATRIVPATARVANYLDESDVVLGMGRVIVEAASRNKVGVLVGYERILDVVDGSNFSRFAANNFSGRGGAGLAPDVVLGRLAALRTPLSEAQRNPFRINVAAAIVDTAFREDCGRTVCDRELAALLEAAIREKASDATIFQLACQRLRPPELETLFRLSAG